jgi:cobalt-zinc-cadmium efflux system membrane fusion protein
MKKSFICFFLAISVIAFSTSCRRTRELSNKTSQEVSQASEEGSQETQTPYGRQRGQQKKQAVGRGFNRQGLGRNSKRAWNPGDVVELSAEEEKAVEIKTVIVSFRPMRSHLQALGKIFAHPMRKAIVSYPFAARVAEIHVLIGDWVKSGQKLITLQSEEVGTAKSEFYKAMADHELAKVNYERQKRLFDRGVGAQKDYLSSQTDFKVAEANLNAAEKKLHVLGFTEEQVRSIADTHQISPIISLYAPISGKIIDHKATLGAMVDQENEILTILDPSLLCVHAEIYERDIAKIRIGQQVEVSVPAYPGETFGGKITYISDVLNEDTRTITVRSDVENGEYKLKPGMFADIKIFLNHQTQALAIPTEAILDERDENIVFLKIQGKYLPQIVEVGTHDADYVEILSGIQEGDEVVTKGSYQLKSKLYDEILKKAGIH